MLFSQKSRVTTTPFLLFLTKQKKGKTSRYKKSPVLSDRKSNAGGDVDLQSNFWPLSQLDDIKAKTRSQSNKKGAIIRMLQHMSDWIPALLIKEHIRPLI